MGIVRRFNLRVPMRDGVTLSANLYRPDDDGEHPGLLVRTPYNKNSEVGSKRSAWFAERGYSVVWMDVRGRGDSDGDFYPYVNDARDGFDSIEWMAGQEWCNGRVATHGGSYGGQIQWLTALEQPPHLKAMVAFVSPSDPFVEWPTGDPSPMYLCWYRLVSGRLVQHLEDTDWADVYKHLPLRTMDVRAGFECEPWQDALDHPTLDDYWETLRYQNRFHEIDVPVLHVSGWYDDEQIGTPLNFAGMGARAPSESTRRAQRLLMGPWGHTTIEKREIGGVDFGADAVVDMDGIVLRWLDHHMKDEANGVDADPPVRLFVMGRNEWRDAATWPLPEAVATKFFLHSGGNANSRFGDGELSTEPPLAEPADVYLSDPANPVPFITEPLSSQIGGPDDYSAIEHRGDVLVYSTRELEDELEVIGGIRVVLFASSSALDTDFTAKLVDVHPGGRCQRLCDGIVRARYREGFGKEVRLEPGEVYRFEIDVWNTTHVFLPGHRVRLEIASSAFPKFSRNLQTGGSQADETEMKVAENRVFHDAERAGYLVLPVIG